MRIPAELQAVIDCDIPLNSSRRVVHRECSDFKNAAMSVKRLSEGYVFNCFRCGYRGFIGGQKLPANQILSMVKSINTKKEMDLEEVLLPADIQDMDIQDSHTSIPIGAFAYLWDGGINDTQIEDVGFGWSETHRRVIIPIHNEEGDLTGWTGRDPFYSKDGNYKQNKYILRKKAGPRIYFTCHEKDATTVVLVEDPISAIRVNTATGLETVALLNTNVGSDLLHEYMEYKMVIWLDDGQLANMVNVVAKAQSYGIECTHISTSKDPKHYNDAAIGIKLKGRINDV